MTAKEEVAEKNEWSWIIPVPGCGPQDVKVTAARREEDWTMFGGGRKREGQFLEIRAKSSVPGYIKHHECDLLVSDTFDLSTTKATVVNGVLTLTISKKSSSIPARTPIQVS